MISYGLDVGGTKVLAVALDDRDLVVGEVRLPTPRPRPGEEPTATLVEMVSQAVALLAGRPSGAGADRLVPGEPLGVGLPGVADAHGRLTFAPNLPEAVGVDLAGALRRTGLRDVWVDNDATLATLAEARAGAARGVAEALMVTLGTGIGGGVVSDGRLRTGAQGFAAEVGHMVVDPDGPPCPCGRRGCWERFASGAGLLRLAGRAASSGRLTRVLGAAGGDMARVRGEDVGAAALAGDPEALAVLGELAEWVALGLANLAAVLDPALVVVGGGLAELGETLLGPTRRALVERLPGRGAWPGIGLVAARFGERAGAVGAAMAARRGGLR
ncbi:MAG TPA: ROK family protein [Acidimicrobiales bacterium]